MEFNQDIFIKRLTELMENNDMTQTKLSHKIGTTNVTISRYLSGERLPHLEIIAKIASVFNTSIDYLLGYSDIPITTNTKNLKSLAKFQEVIGVLKLGNKKGELSDAQIKLIKKLLDANKDFILYADDLEKAKRA